MSRAPFLIVSGLLCTQLAQASTVTVNGDADVFAAGQSSVPNLVGGGGELPPSFSFQSGSGLVVTFPSVTGTVSGATCCFPFQGPDGWTGGSTFIGSYGGVSGIRDDNRLTFLAGVFLDNSTPSGSPPPSLDFTGAENFGEFAPLVGQTFYIGDGRTGTGSGAFQRFDVPVTATRLFLGFVDGPGAAGNPPGDYSDNGGSLAVTFQVTPEPGSVCLACLGSIAILVLQRRKFWWAEKS